MLSAAIVDCLQGIVNSRPFPKITKIRGSINRELDQLGETTMDAAHIHLLLNHIPILGTIFGLLLLCYGTWRHSDEIKKASLGTFVIVALITIVVYLTGDGAAQIVGNLPGVSDAIIRRHDNAATLTFWPIEILGVLSLLSLWLGRGDQTFFDIALPGFVISDSAFRLFASQVHFLSYKVDSGCPVLLLVETISRCFQIELVSNGPFGFHFFGGLYAPLLRHNATCSLHKSLTEDSTLIPLKNDN